MPRYRAIYLVWLIGSTLIVGIWLHSVGHHTAVVRSSTSGTIRTLLLSGGGISLEVLHPPGNVSFPPAWRFLTQQEVIGSTFFGEFRWGAQDTEFITTSGVGTAYAYELPLWVIELSFTFICLPFMLRANRKYNQARAAVVADHRSQRDRS